MSRENPICVISKGTFGDNSCRDIQTNESWTENPYGEDYVIVPDEMVQEILKTEGFCDIELNEAGTEIISFTARDIPEAAVPAVPELRVPGLLVKEISDTTNTKGNIGLGITSEYTVLCVKCSSSHIATPYFYNDGTNAAVWKAHLTSAVDNSNITETEVTVQVYYTVI